MKDQWWILHVDRFSSKKGKKMSVVTFSTCGVSLEIVALILHYSLHLTYIHEIERLLLINKLGYNESIIKLEH